MRTKYFLNLFVIGFAAIGIFIFVNNVFGQETPAEAGIQYPIQELSNCQSKDDCKSYCDKTENLQACVNFGEKNNLISEEEVQAANNFIKAGANGPGGCKTKDSCEEYCNNMDHLNECVAFAEENNLMSPRELAEAKKVQQAIARGVKAPSCGSKKACDTYCEESDHMEECITFAKEAGFLEGKELEDADKMLAAIKRGVTPPPCKGKDACDAYCSTPENMEVCMNFAMEAGMMSEQEKADAQKMLAAIKRGVTPPNCKSKDQCDAYCGQEEHFEECMNFAVAAGFMSEEDAIMARKTGGKGPGDCKGKEECEAFCNDPANQQTCFDFAKEHGLISEEDLKQMEEGKQQMMNALNQAPTEVLDCLNSKLGAETVAKIKDGTAMPSREIGDTMQTCFQEVGSGPRIGPSSDTMMEGGGPGGCQTPEECQAYCQQNPEECQNFAPPEPWQEGQPKGDEIMPPKQTGPGGCQSPEECEAYCSEHREECGAPPQQQQEPMNPIPCEGEGCQSPPPPESAPQPAPEPPPAPSGLFNQNSSLASLVNFFNLLIR